MVGRIIQRGAYSREECIDNGWKCINFSDEDFYLTIFHNSMTFLTYLKIHKSFYFLIVYDSICHMKKLTGPCLAYMKRFFYNTETGKCEQFVYGGCKGNQNNFLTELECKTRCIKGDLIEIVF